MQGVVSLLDDRHTQIVKDIWQELKTKCRIVGTHVPKFPHFSYHVAENYHEDALHLLLKDISARQKIFKVKTAGLGIFNGAFPVLYIPIVRDPELTQFHQSIYPPLSTTTQVSLSYYAPQSWMPHITLAQGDLTIQNLPEVLHVLNDRDFAWEIEINNLTLLSTDGIKMRFDFDS